MKNTRTTEKKIWKMIVTDCQEMPLREEEFETEDAAMIRFNEINARANADPTRFPEEIAEKPYPATVRR